MWLILQSNLYDIDSVFIKRADLHIHLQKYTRRVNGSDFSLPKTREGLMYI